MKQKDIGDILGGVLMAAIGLFALAYAQRYSFGSVRMMGPGFFPVLLGGLLVVLGVMIAVPAFRRSGPEVTFQWKTLTFVISAIAVFGFTLRPLGLVLSTMLAVLVAASADRNFSWLGRITLALALAVIVYLIFSLGLGMTLPVWPRGF